MAFIPASNSVVAFQSKPSSLLAGVSVIGLTPVNLANSSVTALQGTNPWQINVPSPSTISYQLAGSVLAVSGSFSASPQASINALQLGGSVLAVRTDDASVIVVLSRSSVAVLQGTDPWKVNVPTPSYISYQAAGSVLAVSGTFSASPQYSIMAQQLAGSILAVRTDDASVVAVLSRSSVAVLQGTDPWKVNVPTPSYIAYQAAGSVMAVSATVNTGNSSVQLLGGVATIGSVTAIQGTNPYVMTGSVQGTISVLGTIPVTQSGTWITSLVNTVPSSLVVGASIIGVVPITGTITANPQYSIMTQQLAGSVLAVRHDDASVVAVLSRSSVAVLQGTNPWVVNVPTPSLLSIQPAGSVLNVNISGSVAAFVGNNIGSIVGTYAEDAGHTSSDKGLFILGVRNDNMSSTASANLDYTIHAQDAQGRTVIKPFIPNDGTLIEYQGSVVSTSVTLIKASVTGSRSYITDFWIANTGSVSTLITFQDGSTSILGYTIAPATGGSNSQGINLPHRTAPSQDLAFKVTTAVSVLYLTVRGYQGE